MDDVVDGDHPLGGAHPRDGGSRQAWQRWLRAEEQTGPMPIVERLRSTPFSDPRTHDVPDEDGEQLATLQLAERVGEMLFRSGAGTRDVETSLIAVSAALGLVDVEVDVTVQSMLLHTTLPNGQTLTTVRVARGQSRDFARLTGAFRLVDDLASGRVDRQQAVIRLDELEAARKPWPRWVVSVAFGVLAAAVCLLVGGGPVAIGVAFVASVVVDRVGRLVARRGLPSFFVTALGAAVVSGLVVLAVAVGLLRAADAAAVVAGGIVVLLPGRQLVSAVEDAIGGFSVTASGRVLGVLLTTAAIIAGVGAGLGLAGAFGLDLVVDTSATTAGDVTRGALAAALASLASAVSYRSKRSLVLPAGVIGVVAYVVLGLLSATGVAGVVAATAAAAVTVGLLARVVADRVRAPALVLQVPALSALLPGLAIFRAMSDIGRGAPTGTIELFSAATIALALASGVVLGDILAAPADPRRRARRRAAVQDAVQRAVDARDDARRAGDEADDSA
jgi:uncharacterized membrane protein YjjP (DUF1212 family)